MGRHDGGPLCGVLAVIGQRLVRCGHRRHSRPADARAGLPKGRLPGHRHHHRGCRVICHRWAVPADSRAVPDRLRGLARALRLRRWTFGRQQGLRRRPGRLYGRGGRCVADRLAAKRFHDWRQPRRGDRGGSCRARPGRGPFAAPNVHPGLFGKLAAAQQRVRAFALAILRGESAQPTHLANLLREITALHPDITALAINRATEGREARRPGALPWRWSPRSARRRIVVAPRCELPSLSRRLARPRRCPRGGEPYAAASVAA